MNHGQLYYSGRGSLGKCQKNLFKFEFFKMDLDKLCLLSFTEYVEYLWLLGVGFMEKSVIGLQMTAF